MEHAIEAEVRLYDRLFTVPEPDDPVKEKGHPLTRMFKSEETEPSAPVDFKSFINPKSLEVVVARCEPALANARPEDRYQFERIGYFALDPDSSPAKQVWNRTLTSKDTWAKEKKF